MDWQQKSSIPDSSGSFICLNTECAFFYNVIKPIKYILQNLEHVRYVLVRVISTVAVQVSKLQLSDKKLLYFIMENTIVMRNLPQ